MKLTAIIILVACLQVSARTNAQRLSISLKNSSLENLFKEIEKKTTYVFFYDVAILKNAKPVTVEMKDVSVDMILSTVLKDKNLDLDYYINDKTIFIKRKGGDEFRPGHTGGDPHKSIKVFGTVYNESGEPLSGANVILKFEGTEKGTITDAKGQFDLGSVAIGSTVVVSFIGYSPQQIKMSANADLKIYLKVTKNELDRVVVQAYGSTTQRLATGDIGTVRAEDIAKQPVMNVLDALQGQVAGVVVTNTSGYASGAIKVEIRGRNTLNPNFPSDPLYIIDGVPLTILDLTGQSNYQSGSQGAIQTGLFSPANGQSPFFSINPADIESIEVLKDADATAIYGSRGSNGVILITTKKGKVGKTKFDLNVYSGEGKTPRHYQMLNTQQYVSMRKEALNNDGLPEDINNAPDLVLWDTTRYTDWQKYLWGGIGKTTDVQSSLSGGNSQTTFRIGAGYHNQKDILVASGASERGSLSFNLNHKTLDQRFSMSFSGAYSFASINTIYLPGSINLSPNAPPIYDKEGNLNFGGWAPLDGNFSFGTLLQSYTSKTNFLTSSLGLNYELLKGLTAKVTLGYNNIQTTQQQLTPIASLDPAIGNPVGQNQTGYTFVNNLITEPQLKYLGFVGKGKLDVLAGASFQQNNTSSASLEGVGYTTDALISSVGNAPNQYASNARDQYKYAAVFGRLNYNWEDKYIINLNARRDGSSRFGPGRQYGNFGSVGAAWIFTEEGFAKKNLLFLSFGKLKGSIGRVGGDQIGDYSYISRWQFYSSTYNGVLPLNPLGHSDSLLHWQVNRKMQLSLDLGFIKDRITIEATWYRNRCDDQLVQFPTPLFTGFSNVTSNSPADVQNTGWEFVANGKLIDNRNFKWSVKFNIGLNRNKLLAYPNLANSPYADIYIVGQPLNIQRALHVTGVDPETGLYTFKDKNKDGQITVDFSGKNDDDRYVYNLTPKYDGGFTNSFSYKNWQLSFFIYFRKQLGYSSIFQFDLPGDITNQSTHVLDRWQHPGDQAKFARFTNNPFSYPSFIDYKFYSDGVFSDASYLRLQNLSLSYTLPVNGKKKAALPAYRVYIQGENLFTITKYDGLDPELQSMNTIPLPRIITVGLSCNF